MALPLRVGPEFLEQGADVGGLGGLARVAPGEGEIGLQHPGHLVHVALQILELGRGLQHLQRQTEAREHRAQVMADAVQHGGALLDLAGDPALHVEEGGPRAADLARAARPEIELAALAEILGRVRQRQDRPDLVAQEEDRDREQDQRGAHHPDQEDVGVGGVGLAAARDDAHHGVVELDADVFNPLLVGLGVGQASFEFFVIDHATLFEVDQEHLAGLQPPLANDLAFWNGQHA